MSTYHKHASNASDCMCRMRFSCLMPPSDLPSSPPPSRPSLHSFQLRMPEWRRSARTAARPVTTSRLCFVCQLIMCTHSLQAAVRARSREDALRFPSDLPSVFPIHPFLTHSSAGAPSRGDLHELLQAESPLFGICFVSTYHHRTLCKRLYVLDNVRLPYAALWTSRPSPPS